MTERIPMESYSLSTHAKGCDPCMKLVGQLTCAVLWQHENRGRAKEALWGEGGGKPANREHQWQFLFDYFPRAAISNYHKLSG